MSNSPQLYCTIPHPEEDLVLRALAPGDIEPIVDYWFGPHSALVRVDMDTSKLGSPDDLRKRLETRLHSSNSLNGGFMLVLSRSSGSQQALGYGLLKDFDSKTQSAGAHVHIFDPGDRGRGLAKTAFWSAIKVFFEQLPIEVIRLEAPTNVIGSNRLLQSLGIRYLGRETMSPDSTAHECELNRYEITREEAGFRQSSS